MSSLAKRKKLIKKYLSLKVFDRIGSFEQLEKHITDLPNKYDRNIAFELFAEAYFATQFQHEIKVVMPINIVPTQIKLDIQ